MLQAKQCCEDDAAEKEATFLVSSQNDRNDENSVQEAIILKVNVVNNQ